MTDWAEIAAALSLDLREQDRATVIAALEKLERDFAPLRRRIPFDEPPWTGPEQ